MMLGKLRETIYRQTGLTLKEAIFKPHHTEPDGNIFLPHHFYYGVIIMLAGWFWWGQSPTGGIITVIGLAIAADDILEHYFGWPMPLDRLFKLALKNKAFRTRYIALLKRFNLL